MESLHKLLLEYIYYSGSVDVNVKAFHGVYVELQKCIKKSLVKEISDKTKDDCWSDLEVLQKKLNEEQEIHKEKSYWKKLIPKKRSVYFKTLDYLLLPQYKFEVINTDNHSETDALFDTVLWLLLRNLDLTVNEKKQILFQCLDMFPYVTFGGMLDSVWQRFFEGTVKEKGATIHCDSIDDITEFNNGRKCLLCNSYDHKKTSTPVDGLKQHLRYKHSIYSEICGIQGCKKTFNRPHELLKHKQTQHDQNQYKCSRCPVNFSKKRSLTDHETTEHGIKKRLRRKEDYSSTSNCQPESIYEEQPNANPSASDDSSDLLHHADMEEMTGAVKSTPFQSNDSSTSGVQKSLEDKTFHAKTLKSNEFNPNFLNDDLQYFKQLLQQEGVKDKLIATLLTTVELAYPNHSVKLLLEPDPENPPCKFSVVLKPKGNLNSQTREQFLDADEDKENNEENGETEGKDLKITANPLKQLSSSLITKTQLASYCRHVGLVGRKGNTSA